MELQLARVRYDFVLVSDRCSNIPQGVDTIHLELFDEKAFTADDKIAWTLINVRHGQNSVQSL